MRRGPTLARATRLAVLGALLGVLLVLLPVGSASAAPAAAVMVHVPAVSFPGLDCTDPPTPDMPGEGLSAFFGRTPTPLPKQEDPFAKGSTTTMYEQYGYAGLRWHTYDLGCGPDAARDPAAVMGTALSNWLMNLPISMCALTASITDVAFDPTFLRVFDPAIRRISHALHQSLFAAWLPALLAFLGIGILLKARRSALSTTAATIGWALMVILIATALFRWPVQAGHFADSTVTSTLGSVVDKLDGQERQVEPAVAVASNVQASIFYNSWLAGTLGSTDSPTAKKYGPDLFKAQALTWHEASVVEHDPAKGKAIIETKQDDWKRLAAEIKANDPSAYEHLQGKRSDTRVGYAVLATVATLLALPFLLVSAFLLLGSFLIVRLAVMMFPAFAVLGIFPAGRGLVIGIGRTVGAAFVNSVIFGIGAAITIRVIGLILDPQSKIPGWLALVLMPLFGFVMWVALKPFRRLTAMVSPQTDPFGDGAGAFGDAARSSKKWAKKAAATGVGVYSGNVAAAATIDAMGDDSDQSVPDRVESRPSVAEPATSAPPQPPALELSSAIPSQRDPSVEPGQPPIWDRGKAAASFEETAVPWREPSGDAAPLPPIEAELVDGEEVYALYRPGVEDADDAA